MRLRDMKKLFIALAAVALTACVKAPEKTVKVYAWQGEGGNTTEQTLQADFAVTTVSTRKTGPILSGTAKDV